MNRVRNADQFRQLFRRIREPGQVPGLAFFGMELELSEMLGRKVDLHTAKFLSRYFRDQVLAEA